MPHHATPPRASRRRAVVVGALVLLLLGVSENPHALRAASDGPPHPGLELLLHEPLSLQAFTTNELARLWTVWEEEARAEAEAASDDERRKLTYARYGLIERGPDCLLYTSPSPRDPE